MKIPENVMTMLGDIDSIKVLSSASVEGRPHSSVADSMMAMGEDRLFVMETETDTTFNNMRMNSFVAVLINKGEQAYHLMAKTLERYTEGDFYEVMTKAARSRGANIKAVWTLEVLEN